MMQRAGIKGMQLAEAASMTPATFSRRMAGKQAWTLFEVEMIAMYFGLQLDELVYELPSIEEWERRTAAEEYDVDYGRRPWAASETAAPPKGSGRDLYAIRDSNPEPADMEHGVVVDLSAWRAERAA